VAKNRRRFPWAEGAAALACCTPTQPRRDAADLAFAVSWLFKGLELGTLFGRTAPPPTIPVPDSAPDLAPAPG
jgi:hypothetical protein